MHPNVYLFKPLKKSKAVGSVSETFVSSSAPLQAIIEKKKRKKVVKKFAHQIPTPMPFDEGFDSNEPLAKKTRRIVEVESIVEPAIVVDFAALTEVRNTEEVAQ